MSPSLTRRSLSRVLAAGFGVGVLTLAAFLLTTPLVSPGEVFVLSLLSYLTVALALVAPVWGALARGVV